MAQFDVYTLDRSGDLFLELQSQYTTHLPTRIGAPLILRTPFSNPVEKLHPTLVVDDQSYIMLTHHIFSLPTRDLRHKVANLEHEQYIIKSALDMLFYGF